MTEQEKYQEIKKPKKGWAIFMIIVLLVVVASGGFFFIWNQKQMNDAKKEAEEKIVQLQQKIEQQEQQQQEQEEAEVAEEAQKQKEEQEKLAALQNVPDEDKACKVDTDCVPNPAECHPQHCINSELKDKYDSGEPMACTMMIDSEATYAPEDCVCKESICVNKNASNAEGAE